MINEKQNPRQLTNPMTCPMPKFIQSKIIQFATTITINKNDSIQNTHMQARTDFASALAQILVIGRKIKKWKKRKKNGDCPFVLGAQQPQLKHLHSTRDCKIYSIRDCKTWARMRNCRIGSWTDCRIIIAFLHSFYNSTLFLGGGVYKTPREAVDAGRGSVLGFHGRHRRGRWNRIPMSN